MSSLFIQDPTGRCPADFHDPCHEPCACSERIAIWCSRAAELPDSETTAEASAAKTGGTEHIKKFAPSSRKSPYQDMFASCLRDMQGVDFTIDGREVGLCFVEPGEFCVNWDCSTVIML